LPLGEYTKSYVASLNLTSFRALAGTLGETVKTLYFDAN